MKEKLLIIGSEGRIGKMLCSYFKDKFDIVGIDVKENSSLENYFKVDISNFKELEKISLSIKNCYKLIHLAGSRMMPGK